VPISAGIAHSELEPGNSRLVAKEGRCMCCPDRLPGSVRHRTGTGRGCRRAAREGEAVPRIAERRRGQGLARRHGRAGNAAEPDWSIAGSIDVLEAAVRSRIAGIVAAIPRVPQFIKVGEAVARDVNAGRPGLVRSGPRVLLRMLSSAVRCLGGRSIPSRAVNKHGGCPVRQHFHSFASQDDGRDAPPPMGRHDNEVAPIGLSHL
jgi:hypothetical protein